MADPDFNLQSLHSNFQKAYEAVMSGSGPFSNDSGQKQAIAFGQQVKQAVPNDYLNNSLPRNEVTFHNPLCDFRFKKVPVTVIYSQEPHLGEPPDLPVKAKLHSPQSSNQSEIKIVQVWSMAVKKDSNSVDNSHQYSNLMEQVSQIIPAANSSNIDASQTVQTQECLVHSEAVAIRTNWEGKAHIKKHVSNSSEETTDNKAIRLERQRERKRELRKDPVYAKRERERQRERRKERYQTDPGYVERQRKRQRERKRERYQTDPEYAERQRERNRECLRKRYQTDPDYAERQRERKRELRKDPVYAERLRKRQRERQRKRYQTDPDYAERERKRKREFRKNLAYAKHQRGHKKQHCRSVNSAETTQSSSKNSEGAAPRFSVVKLKEYLQPRSPPLSLSERSVIEGSEGIGHCPLDRQTA